jgi:hypothetical protein
MGQIFVSERRERRAAIIDGSQTDLHHRAPRGVLAQRMTATPSPTWANQRLFEIYFATTSPHEQYVSLSDASNRAAWEDRLVATANGEPAHRAPGHHARLPGWLTPSTRGLDDRPSTEFHRLGRS